MSITIRSKTINATTVMAGDTSEASAQTSIFLRRSYPRGNSRGQRSLPLRVVRIVVDLVVARVGVDVSGTVEAVAVDVVVVVAGHVVVVIRPVLLHRLLRHLMDMQRLQLRILTMRLVMLIN